MCRDGDPVVEACGGTRPGVCANIGALLSQTPGSGSRGGTDFPEDNAYPMSEPFVVGTRQHAQAYGDDMLQANLASTGPAGAPGAADQNGGPRARSVSQCRNRVTDSFRI